MNFNDAFPSRWLKAKDLQGHALKVTIARQTIETVGEGDESEEKWVVYFEEGAKGLMLNKTNGTIIADAYGDESEDWVGHPLELYPDKVNFKGDLVDCLRVRIPVPAAEPGDVDIPF